jgi:chromatin segregation and condensation protein Rec8/ScpA/Scc1 (kleisin family)
VSGVDQVITPRPQDLDLPIGADDLAAMAYRVFSRQNAEPDLDHLDLDLPSVEAAIDELRARVAEMTMATFEDLTAHCSRTVEVAAYFLALLELARWGLISVSQEDWLSEIVVSDRGEAASGFSSEWAS